MKNLLRFATLILAGVLLADCSDNDAVTVEKEGTVFVFGGDIHPTFVDYVAGLIGKDDPAIVYLPTASGDNEDNIKYWDYICRTIGIEPRVMKVWVSSDEENESFEDILLSADAIVVGGGNTLNMLGIWKEQGIDLILRQALRNGVILAGGSAGSICWFTEGVSDSRPVELSVVKGLGWLGYSNCPHYGDTAKKELYHELIAANAIPAGYACDDNAGILFKDGEFVEAVSLNGRDNAYFVKSENRTAVSESLQPRIILRRGALGENEYTSTEIGDKIEGLSFEPATPLSAFVETMIKMRPDKTDNITVEKIFVLDDRLAGVVHDAYDGFYAIMYLYYDGVRWQNLGEDIGGQTLVEAEIVFREKARIMEGRAFGN